MKERVKRRTVQVHKGVSEGEEVIGRVSFTFDETRLSGDLLAKRDL